MTTILLNRNRTVFALIAAWGLSSAYSSPQLAEAVDTAQPDGPIVQISPNRGEVENRGSGPAVEHVASDEAVYWIGLRGRLVDDAALRTQLQLAEDTGIVIEQVIPNSPADKAGLRKHDILLRADGDNVEDMTVLQQKVSASDGAPIELKLLRLGKEISVVVTPEERPEGIGEQFQDRQMNRLDGDGLSNLLEQFQGNGLQLPQGMRVFGPGIMLNRNHLDLRKFPSGISVSISRENDGEPTITVRKGDQEWIVTGGDNDALSELPDELQPLIRRLLEQGGVGANFGFGNLDLEAELDHWLPDRLPGFESPRVSRDQLLQRMEQLEQRLHDLQQRFRNDIEAGKETE